jgi:hypothetical protein
MCDAYITHPEEGGGGGDDSCSRKRGSGKEQRSADGFAGRRERER